MSILTDVPQNFISVSGKKYPINTDFRVWLRFSENWEGTGTDAQKLVNTIKLCFDKSACAGLPENVPEMIRELMIFYSGANSIQKEKKSVKSDSDIRIFSFSEDAEYIYASFFSQYHIDLTSLKYLHWHKFLALFRSLSGDCRFMKIISYRQIDLSEIQDKKQREFYRRMKEIYALPDMRSSSRKERDFARELGKLF